MVGQENIDAAMNAYKGSALESTVSAVSDAGSSVVDSAEKGWQEVQELKARNEKNAKYGNAWYDNRGIEGPQTWEQSFAEENKPMEEVSVVPGAAGSMLQKGLGKLAGRSTKVLHAPTGNMSDSASKVFAKQAADRARAIRLGSQNAHNEANKRIVQPVMDERRADFIRQMYGK